MISFFIVLLPDALRLKADLTFDLAALGMSAPNFAEIVYVIVSGFLYVMPRATLIMK